MEELEKILEEIEVRERICLEIDNSDEFNAGALDMAISIKDIIRKHMNDGWIPVSQNVPVNNNPVLIWSVNSEQKSEGFSIGSYDYGVWWIGMLEGILTFPTFLKPIAWRHLPEPYRTERSNEHDGE